MGCGVAVFLAQTATLCCALLISASRIADNKHHPMDVVAGAALGVTVQGNHSITILKFDSLIRYYKIDIDT